MAARRNRLPAATVATMCGLLFVAFGSSARAATQTINATLATSIAMTTEPDPTITWALVVGANSKSGGAMTISANTPYIVTVAAEKATLTEWNTATSTYVTGGKTLATALTVTPAATGGTAALVGSAITLSAPAVAVAPSTIVAGTGLTTDTFSITLGQLVLVSDQALAAGRTYRNVLTYTASAPI